MNSDIGNIYKGGVLQRKEIESKKKAIQAEKRLKDSVTSKPFNIQGLKNIHNVRDDI